MRHCGRNAGDRVLRDYERTGVKNMEQKFLEQESRRANAKNRKLFLKLFLFDMCLFIGFGLVLKNFTDLDDNISTGLLIVGAILLILIVAKLIHIRKTAAHGENLLLPFREDTKEAVGRVIDREVAEGKILVEEYMVRFPEGKTPHGDRVILTPSYLLLCHSMGKITAIPREKIYWLCAQVGRKGSSPFIVRLQIFTEKKVFEMTGGEPEYLEKIAEKLYTYIPNIFYEYDPFILSYELERLFDQNRAAFLEFYEEERRKYVGLA